MTVNLTPRMQSCGAFLSRSSRACWAHRQPRMTLRYANVGDREIQAAAERIGSNINCLPEGR